MINKITGIFAIILLHVAVLTAQTPNSDAHIAGHVIDNASGAHLPYVSITIKGSVIGTSTDATGHYRLRNVPTGAVTVVASFVGYEAQEKEVFMEPGKIVMVNFELAESTLTLNDVVISASRDEVRRKEAVTVVSVLTPKTFEATNSVSLADGLNFQPGLRVENNCQNCGFPQLRINGLEGPYTQILMDSRAINSALAGVYGLEHIPVNMVERVEIVRGGGSALFGSSAVGGTVNIITKEPSANTITVGNTSSLVYGKTPDIATHLNASVVSENSRAGVTLFASSRQRSPFDYDGDGFSEIGKINMKNIGFRGYYRTGSHSKLTLEYHSINEFRRGGNNFIRPPHEADIAEQTDHLIHSGGLKYDLFGREARHALQVYASMQHIGRESYYGSGKDPNAYGNTKDFSSVTGAQYTLRMKQFLVMPAVFISGIEYSHNALKDEMVGYGRVIDQTIGIYSLFAQNEWRNSRLSILIGGRIDRHTMIDGVIVSPRISARFAPVEWLNLRAGFASGYRGPQAFDEDLHVTAVGQGVALIRVANDLKPEMSQSFTLSAEFSRAFPNSAYMLLIEGFHTSLRHVFLLEETGKDADGNLLLERRNGSGAVVTGVNLEANIALFKDFNINSGFTVQSSLYSTPEQWSETVDPQRTMFRAPSTYGYITASHYLKKHLELALSGTYTGHMLVQHFAGYIDSDTEATTPAFFDLHFKAGYDFQLKENTVLQLAAGVKNIFNSYQKDFDRGEFRDAGYLYGPVLPRTVFVGLRLSI